MYGSWDKAGHYFSDVRRSIDALYFAYFITRYYPAHLLSLRAPPPSFRAPWASLYELTELGGREKKMQRTRIKKKKSRMSENSGEIRENNGGRKRADESGGVQGHFSYADLINPKVSSFTSTAIFIFQTSYFVS